MLERFGNVDRLRIELDHGAELAIEKWPGGYSVCTRTEDVTVHYSACGYASRPVLFETGHEAADFARWVREG
jgi:hypothetical protein